MKGRLSDTLPMILTLIEAQDTNLIYVRSISVFHVVPTLIHSRGCGRPENTPLILENYFEKTDALVWVVDATDRLRVEDCCVELHGLLQEEVSCRYFTKGLVILTSLTEAFRSKFAYIRQQN